jgi:hypothetical protein
MGLQWSTKKSVEKVLCRYRLARFPEDFSSKPGFESEFHVVASTSGPSIRFEIVAQNEIDVLDVQNC